VSESQSREELGLDYELKPVNVKNAEQKSPDLLALNPNGKVPVLIDPDGPAGEPITLTESGAILIYLAEKTGRLLPQDLGGSRPGIRADVRPNALPMMAVRRRWPI
jgi:glutathione S-transferase